MRVSADIHTRFKYLPRKEYYSPQQIADLMEVDVKDIDLLVKSNNLPAYNGEIRWVIARQFVDRLYYLKE